ncbi:hypothetical protein BKA93DRAFT_598769 [Sparassis latifolia]
MQRISRRSYGRRGWDVRRPNSPLNIWSSSMAPYIPVVLGGAVVVVFGGFVWWNVSRWSKDAKAYYEQKKDIVTEKMSAALESYSVKKDALAEKASATRASYADRKEMVTERLSDVRNIARERIGDARERLNGASPQSREALQEHMVRSLNGLIFLPW